MVAPPCAAGEFLYGWEQDFQCGVPRSFARCRRIESGELFVLNVGVDFRGYPSELSKTLAVINRPTVIKHAAHDKIVKVMMLGETMLKLGKSCRDMYEIIFGELDG